MEKTIISRVKRSDGNLPQLFNYNNSTSNIGMNAMFGNSGNYGTTNSGSSSAPNNSNSGGSTGIWDKIFNNAGGLISSVSEGIASIVQAKTGNYPTYQQDNTPKVLAIAGVVAVVLIIILVIIFKK